MVIFWRSGNKEEQEYFLDFIKLGVTCGKDDIFEGPSKPVTCLVMTASWQKGERALKCVEEGG